MNVAAIHNRFVIFSGGGTGGHIFPALTLAKELERTFGVKILFVGSGKAIERTMIGKAGYPYTQVVSSKLKRVGMIERFKALFNLPLSFIQAFFLLIFYRPFLVVGYGGYASFPMCIVGFFIGKKIVLLEQNAIPGLTNRILNRFADRVFTSFPESNRFFVGKNKIVHAGNPIRESFKSDVKRGKAEKKDPGLRYITVFGGSQGSTFLNAVVPAAIATMPRQDQRQYQIFHQTGESEQTLVERAYRGTEARTTIRSFFDDLGYYLGKSDLVIARGGSSVIELAYCGVPAILVPFPGAADNHQQANAKILVDAGGGRLIEERRCDADTLVKHVIELLNGGNSVKKIAEGASSLVNPEAAKTIVDEIARLIGLSR